MKYPVLTAALASAIMTVGLSSPAHATGKMKCEAGPQSGWVSRDTLEADLVKKGWKVKKSKVDGGCYEVYGTTPEGDRVEAYFHPVSMEKLLVLRRGKVLYKK
ncbi:Peptidase propeptide and YPEB domain-containing protein [Parasphingorhabdus marina DSM 22363]|uniref:Peptidase propeptide and YPEB domain-containing protein n=1 Tax=Parasphingorhabdus marina DSM 22363 TaxID=1123272 RepID=A0A1N6CMR2_9SPHN|nr:PepSY domain-containing protein [Parasphingorhabdus marina]SIN59843.1 Peptidase propeptide and YPEB domain-containing protein [Parasphingorhabdus marina DSM 22363]